jgi:putative transposase
MSKRVEPYAVGDFVHIFNRGNNREPIFLSKSDYWRFCRSLKFFNHTKNIRSFSKGARCMSELIKFQKTQAGILKQTDPNNEHNTFEWRTEWGDQEPLVEIISYHLSPNHFHLLLREITPAGISRFMKKLGNGYTTYRNIISSRCGRIFQGAYKGKTVTDERYLQYLDIYIQVLNPFELFDGGIANALVHFDEAFQFAFNYPFCSLSESFGGRNIGIINRNYFRETFKNLTVYKEICHDALLVRNIRELLGKLTLE